MREYIGIDLHKRTATVVKKDRVRRVTGKTTLPTTQAALRRYFCRQDGKSRVVVEATGNWMYLYETIERYTPDVVLAHPLRTKAIASARVKTDTIDATTLAELLRLDGIPAAYIPPREIRDTRELLRYRAALVSVRTGIKNKIHAVLSKNGVDCPWSNVLGKRALVWLGVLKLRSCYRIAIQGYVQLGELLTQLIAQVTQSIKEQVAQSEQAQLLMTVPGISYYSALLILSEIGEIERFPNAKHLCSYAGLVPSVHSSAGKTHYGHITKQGSRWLRWILIEVSTHAANGDARFQRLYRRLRQKHGTSTARVAVARAVLTVVYAMLHTNQPFQGRRPRQRVLAVACSKKSKEVSGHPRGVMVTA